MKTMKLGILAALAAVVLAGCGTVADDASPGAEQLGTNEAAATYPACCSAIPNSGYTEAFCDSIAYSPGRCNAVWGGVACQWNNVACPVTCCQPNPNSTVPWNTCNPYSGSAATCNGALGGNTCVWSC